MEVLVLVDDGDIVALQHVLAAAVLVGDPELGAAEVVRVEGELAADDRAALAVVS